MGTRIIAIIALLLCLLLVCFYRPAMLAARDGFDLWLEVVMPALFPFMVCTSILQRSGTFNLNSNKRSKGRFSGPAVPLLLTCCISGAPSGARLSGMLMESGALCQGDAMRLSAICNLASPMFITGSLCTSMLGVPSLAIPICIAHYGSAFLTLLLSGLKSPYNGECKPKPSNPCQTCQKGPAVVASGIGDGISAMLNICGTIIFFMVLICILRESGALNLINAAFSWLFSAIGLDSGLAEPFVVGLFEMTNGCRLLTGIAAPAHMIASIAAFVITFGGACVYIQSMSFIQLKTGQFFLFKLIQAILAAVIAYLVTPLFISTSVTASGRTDDRLLINAAATGLAIASSLLGIVSVLLLSRLLGYRRLTKT